MLLTALVLTSVAGCIADFPPELVERKDSAVIQDVARLEGSVVDAPGDAPGDAAGDAPGDALHDAPVDIKKLDKSVPPPDKAVPPPDKTIPPPDKSVAPDTPPQCPSVCNGNCPGGVCTIIQGAKTTAVPKCPAKMPCAVVCKGDKACENGVDCSQATDCDITCDADTGADACKNKMVLCGSGLCKVSCTGKDTCNKGIDCYSACGCHIYCKGSQACLTKICPTSPTCCSPPTACQCP